MNEKQYVDYVKRRFAEEERINQKFPHEPIKNTKNSFIEHAGINRKETFNEIEFYLTAAFGFVLVIIVGMLMIIFL